MSSVGPCVFEGSSWYAIQKTSTKHNIKILSTPLKKGEYLEVHVSGLRVVKNETLWSKIKYHFQKKEKKKEVQALISKTVVHLENQLPKDMHDDDMQSMQRFFFNHLAKLSSHVFDSRILGDKTKMNTKVLPEILWPELKNTKKGAALLNETERKLDRRIAKTKLASKLGISLQPISEGTSGSYFAYDHKMKRIGVFKPGREESDGVNTPKMGQRLKNFFIKKVLGIDTHATFWPSEGYISEAMTSKLAEHMHIDVVARSKVTQIKSHQFASAKKRKKGATEETGSFQIFADKAKSADEALHLHSEKSTFYNMFLKLNVWRYKKQIRNRVKPEDFEMMAVIDGLIANRDRHFENWLLKTGSDGTSRIVLIDHQLAFPKVNPRKGDFLYRRNQNKWDVLPQAKLCFRPEMKETAQQLLTGDRLKTLLAALQAVTDPLALNDPKVKQFQDSEGPHSQEFAFKQRVVVLLMALKKKDIKIRKYAAQKSIEEMQAFVNKCQGKHFDLNSPDEIDTYLGIKDPEVV